MTRRRVRNLCLCSATAAFLACAGGGTPPPPLTMQTEIPSQITTPDSVDTRIGKLTFFDGFPDDRTTEKVYDNLDFMRGVDAFLNACPLASLAALRAGMREVGAAGGTIGVFESLMDSKSIFLTPNTETVYALTWLDLSKGPLVVESPPNTLGIVDDFWFRYVTDLGNAGPDKGKGGKYLFLPPDYKGKPPKGYYVFKSATYNNVMFWRGFLVKGDPKPAVENIRKHARIYPLAQAKRPPAQNFVDLSGKAFNTVHANDFRFYEEVNEVVQDEPTEAGDVEILGQLAAIGIAKGKEFAPDERMKKILTDAVAVGNASARALAFRPREPRKYLYPDSAWSVASPDDSYLWLSDGVRNLDARTAFFYVATGVTPAMFAKNVGVGSQYAIAAADGSKRPLDGGHSYTLHLPRNIPAKQFWSIVVYDTQTRSELQTDQQFPSVSSQNPAVKANADGSYDVYFGPTPPPEGKEGNWIHTAAGKGWFLILRLYGPLQPYYDKTWRPGEIEPL